MQRTWLFRQYCSFFAIVSPTAAQPLHSKGHLQHTEPAALAPRRDVAIEPLLLMELLAAAAGSLVAFEWTNESHA